MAPLMLLKGKTLGDTVYRVVVAALLLGLLAWVGWAFVSSHWYAWRADVWKDRAVAASAAVKTATANAASANAGAANATATRGYIDAGTMTVRVETEQAARRIEDYADRPAPVADLAPVDDDIVRELDAAESRYRAPADRLRRADSR